MITVLTDMCACFGAADDMDEMVQAVKHALQQCCLQVRSNTLPLAKHACAAAAGTPATFRHTGTPHPTCGKTCMRSRCGHSCYICAAPGTRSAPGRGPALRREM
jgi:hypothetical protein